MYYQTDRGDFMSKTTRKKIYKFLCVVMILAETTALFIIAMNIEKPCMSPLAIVISVATCCVIGITAWWICAAKL